MSYEVGSDSGEERVLTSSLRFLVLGVLLGDNLRARNCRQSMVFGVFIFELMFRVFEGTVGEVRREERSILRYATQMTYRSSLPAWLRFHVARWLDLKKGLPGIIKYW